MTAWEKIILLELAARFPSTAQATGGRAFRLRPRTAFPTLDQKNPDEYESFLEAAESLEKERIVSLEWEKHRRGEGLSAIVLTAPSLLYQKLNVPFPAEVCARAKAEALKHDTTNSGASFFTWLASNLTAKDIADAGPGFNEETIADTAKLIQELDLIATGKKPPTTTRALSVRLFSDSKHIEFLLAQMQLIFRRAERNGIAVRLFDLVDRSYPETMLAGRIRIEIDSSLPLDNYSGMILAFPFESIIRFRHVVPIHPCRHSPPRVLGIENKETFYAMATSDQFDAIVYVAGHPNRAVQNLFRIFSESGWELFHFGDLDPDGILILQELSDAAKNKIMPWMMRRDIFEKYRSLSRPLDASMHLRAARIRDDIRALDGIEELLAAILSSGRGVEQEIIETETCAPAL